VNETNAEENQSTLFNGFFVTPRRASRFNIIQEGRVLLEMRAGVAYHQAMMNAGHSSRTGGTWKKWAATGEEPYHAFLEMCKRAHRAYLSELLDTYPDEVQRLVRELNAAPPAD